MTTHPKNVLRYCPRCGYNKFNTSDEGRSFHCEECDFVFYINNSAAVACLIFDAEGRLLLARRAVEPSLGKLDLPGGFIEPMESAEEAVIRELREELNVTVTEMKYLVSFPNEYVYSGFSVFTLDLAFICKIDSFKHMVPADDVSAIEFVKLDNINMEELCSKSMQRIIEYYKLIYFK